MCRGTTASANLFSNSADNDTNYHGADITLNKRMSDGWSLLGGASWGKVTARTRGGNRNDSHVLNYFDNDVLASTDRPWSYRLSGVYELPYQVTFSGTWMYQADAPEETTVLVVNNAALALPQGNQTLRIREFGDVRYPNVSQLDMSIRRVFRFGSRTISPRIDFFNATNESTILTWVTQLGSTYHRPSLIQRARLIKVGMNVEF